jgi:hypothetical protein
VVEESYFFALTALHGRIRVAAPVSGKRLSYVDDLLEPSFGIASDVALVAGVGSMSSRFEAMNVILPRRNRVRERCRFRDGAMLG